MVDWDIFVLKLSQYEARELWDPMPPPTYPLPSLNNEEKQIANNLKCDDYNYKGKIPAIKAYRDRTGASIVEAKNKVEEYMNRKPLDDMKELIEEAKEE